MKFLSVLWLIFVLCVETKLAIAGSCHGRLFNPLTDVNRQCIYPLTIGGKTIKGSSIPDRKNPSQPVCVCLNKGIPEAGIVWGFWEPFALIEVVREPFCFPSLGGMKLPLGLNKTQGTVAQSQTNSTERGFYHVHYFEYPMLFLLEAVASDCVKPGVPVLKYASELDPTWNDETLARVFSPASTLFADPIQQALCAEDCTQANAKLANDKLLWCAGCQGSMFPIIGHIQAQVSEVQASLLLTQRTLYRLHRLGQLPKTATTSTSALCKKPKRLLQMEKSMYRTQMIYPKVLKKAGKGGCEPLGRSSVAWESNKVNPITGEDFVYVIWRKRNCCNA
jgi:conjugal transfer pilus assembly protein TraU